jgi:death-on-curing protein
VTLPHWIPLPSVIAIHEALLEQFGGAPGIRDRALLESALMRPQQIFHYERDVTLAKLASAYTFGIISNHPFVDGNKRAAFTVALVFLKKNGRALRADEAEVERTVWALASGAMRELEFTHWIEERITVYKP